MMRIELMQNAEVRRCFVFRYTRSQGEPPYPDGVTKSVDEFTVGVLDLRCLALLPSKRWQFLSSVKTNLMAKNWFYRCFRLELIFGFLKLNLQLLVLCL